MGHCSSHSFITEAVHIEKCPIPMDPGSLTSITEEVGRQTDCISFTAYSKYHLRQWKESCQHDHELDQANKMQDLPRYFQVHLNHPVYFCPVGRLQSIPSFQLCSFSPVLFKENVIETSSMFPKIATQVGICSV